MKIKNIFAYGTLATIYHCKKGEGLPWHDHKHQKQGHGHAVIQGSTHLEVEGEPDRVVTSDVNNIDLPYEKPHQIKALEDDTIFINIAPMLTPTGEPFDPPPYKNRVMLADGTIVET